GTFSVAEADDAPARGTRVVLHLKKSERAFLDPARLRGIVKTYSDHIAIPVVLVEDDKTETLNAASALWMRPKAEVSDAQYKEFYHHVAHAFDDPWLRLHFKVEGKIEYAGLLFVPTVAPFDLYHPERRHGVKLYVKRVFITDDCADLVPPYLRFLRGVIDTEDLPLNISRELLQHNPLLARIREAVAKRVLGELKKKADKAPEEYAGFWNAFGPVLKEGLYEDDARRAELLGLARFASTRAEGLISLADYVTRMHEGQDAIYYISGDSAEALRQSPQIEGFAAKGVEVLLLTDPVDEFWVPAVMEYEGKPLRSVTRGGVDLDKIAGMAGADSEAVTDGAETPPLAASEAGMDALVAYVRLALKDEVKDVRPSQRLTDSAVCLVADEGDLDMHLERLLKQHRQVDQAAKRILEINPRHSLIRRLAAALEEDGAGAPGAALEDVPWLLLDQARILEGEPLPDPAGFAKRLSAVVERGFPLGG
ncbi:MAG: molecular chaperone HtpG, partial [Kiloniellaceae bacterium]